MVCYARPAGRVAAIILVVSLVLGRLAGRHLDTAGVMAAITVVTAGASIAAALAFAAFLSTRRSRAAAGGCVSCQFRCQQAMTGRPRRLTPVSTADRSPDRPAAPRWPDRPAYRSVSPRAPAPGRRAEQPERAGSAV